MSDILIGVIVFGLVFGAAIFGMFLGRNLRVLGSSSSVFVVEKRRPTQFPPLKLPALPRLSQANINKQGSVKLILLYGTERIEIEHEGSCGGETSEGDCGESRFSGNHGSVKSAVDHRETHGLEAAPVTDPEGTLVGKISKDRMIRGVRGVGMTPKRRHWNWKWKKRANLTATNMNRLPRRKK